MKNVKINIMDIVLMSDSNSGKEVENSVSLYLRENPEIFLALNEGIVNISRLASLIVSSRKGLNPISVRAALNRIREKRPELNEKLKADQLLTHSKISLQDKISVVKSERQIQLKYISATYLENSVVYIIDDMIQKVPQERQGVSVESDVSMIHILSPKEIERTPGFIMRITDKLYARGMNILQLISCSNETILILKKEIAVRAYEILHSA